MKLTVLVIDLASVNYKGWNCEKELEIIGNLLRFNVLLNTHGAKWCLAPSLCEYDAYKILESDKFPCEIYVKQVYTAMH